MALGHGRRGEQVVFTLVEVEAGSQETRKKDYPPGFMVSPLDHASG
jgi:hypothetical protein